MPNKDTSQKALLHLPDVLASLVNLLLFDNESIIHPEQVRFLNISSHFQYDSKLHPIYRDACALILDQDQNPSFIFCIENQTRPDRSMPIRAMGYRDTSFFWQREQIAQHLLKDYIPCLTIVFHYGTRKWKGGSLSQLAHFEKYPFLKDLVSDYKMNLENIAWWSREKIEGIQSDFRFIADYCDQMRKTRETKYTPPKNWRIEYVEETLMTLAAFSKDKGLKEAFDQYLEDFRLLEPKGETTMKSVIDHIEQRGFLRAKKIIKSQSEEIKSQSEEIEAKDKEIKVQNQQFIIAARRVMDLQNMTAAQACDFLAYSQKIKEYVLKHIMN